MGEEHDRTTRLQGFLDRLGAGDDAARHGLLEHAYRRLERLDLSGTTIRRREGVQMAEM